MLIREAFAETIPLKIRFGSNAELNIRYRRSSTTFAEMTAMIESAEGIASSASAVEAAASDEDQDAVTEQVSQIRERLGTMRERVIGEVVRTVAEWDLEDEVDGEVVPVPITLESLENVSVEILSRIISEIKESQKASGGKA